MRKFKGKNSGNTYIELFSDEKGSLLENSRGGRAFWPNGSMDSLTEIKEPVKITVWKNVWQRKDGSYFFGCDWPDEQSASADAQGVMYQCQFIKTVKVETEVVTDVTEIEQ